MALQCAVLVRNELALRRAVARDELALQCAVLVRNEPALQGAGQPLRVARERAQPSPGRLDVALYFPALRPLTAWPRR